MTQNILFFVFFILLGSCRLTYGNSAPPISPFSNPEEAQSVVKAKFVDFISHPNLDNLRQLDFLIKRVPTNGNTSSGTPGKDVKLALMLGLISTIDSVWENKKLSISPYPLLPPDVAADVSFTGEDPSAITDPVIRAKYISLIQAHKVDIDYYNFQTELGVKRHALSKMVPIYIKYNYVDSERQHWQELVRRELQSDAKGKDLIDLFISETPVK